MIRILVLSALPQEYSPLKKLIPSWRMLGRRPFKRFAFNLPGKEILLVECGMGPESAREALGAELAVSAPDLLIFSGFAGGLHPDLPVGAVCAIANTRELSSEVVFQFRFTDELCRFLLENHIGQVLSLTAQTAENKQVLSNLASGQHAVLDMETATVAEIAFNYKLPFICFRAISDAIGDDLGFDLSDIADEHGRVRITGVLATIIRRPAVLKSFYLSWRRSRRAARNLCRSLAAFLGIPGPVLKKVAGGITVERE
jgi:adenosylhomocysteine nucleosidase